MAKAFLFLALIFNSYLAFASTTVATDSSQNEKDPMTATAVIQPYEISPGQQAVLKLNVHLPEGFHAYAEQFRVSIQQPEGFVIGKPSISPLTKFFDKNSKRQREGIAKSAVITLPIEAPLSFSGTVDKAIVTLTYQACSEAFCLFPVTKQLEAVLKVQAQNLAPQSMLEAQTNDATVSELKKNSEQPKAKNLRDRFEEMLTTNKFLALLLVFLAGVLTSFTPCIFPMIPITLAILNKDSEKRSRLQNFILAFCYVVGIATTYSILGMIAASSGAVFGATLGNPYVLGFICLTFFVMALSMYGLFEIQVPAFLRNTLGNSKQSSGLFGAYLTGLIAGLVASPCVGPVLVSILTFVATSRSLAYGFILLFTYAMGLGLIFLLLGAFTELTRKLPRSGPWMDGTKLVLGSMMLGGFYYYLDLLLAQKWFDLALGLGLVIIASAFGAFEKVAGHHPIKFIRKGLMQAVLLVGFGYIVLGSFDLRPVIYGRWINPNGVVESKKLAWQPFSDGALNEAIRSGKPVIVDFYADWCAACLELEEFTFADASVKELSKNFILLQFDATKDSAALKSLKQKFKIQGLPTVVFYNKKGQWVDGLTLTEFENSEKFLQRLQKAQD